MSGSIGSTLRLTLFGRSHGPSVGMTLTGVPAGKTVSPLFFCFRFMYNDT